MAITRRGLLAAGAAAAAVPAQAQDLSIRATLDALRGAKPDAFFAALEAIEARGGTDLVPALIFIMRFTRAPESYFDATLTKLTGEARVGWFQWMLWQEAHPEVVSHPAYIPFKRERLLEIDPNFDVFLKRRHLEPDAMKIRFEEVTWGGVVKDGIPSLDNPDLIPAADAVYMLDDDLVFGVSINGDARAYPLRIMGWHEMFNDVIGGVPLALAYCTLCGSGILFETEVAGRRKPLVFGSSGFLYRSNKLMFDRQTHSLWNQFTGRPVSGKLVESDIALKQRPVVIAPWGAWRADNPATKVLSTETGHSRDYGSGVVYQSYFASDDLMFPTAVDETQLRQKEYVFGIRTAGGAKAWPLKAFAVRKVINDAAGLTNVVLVGDPDGRSVRAYARGDLEFDADLRAGGEAWVASEEALVSPSGARLPRVAGHIAYWFAWNGYLGAGAELYEG